MAKRTYVPMAVDFANLLHGKLTRYQEKLSVDKTPEQITALVNLITCLAQFLAVWFKPDPV